MYDYLIETVLKNLSFGFRSPKRLFKFKERRRRPFEVLCRHCLFLNIPHYYLVRRRNFNFPQMFEIRDPNICDAFF